MPSMKLRKSCIPNSSAVARSFCPAPSLQLGGCALESGIEDLPTSSRVIPSVSDIQCTGLGHFPDLEVWEIELIDPYRDLHRDTGGVY